MAQTPQNDIIREWLEQYDESCKEFTGVFQRDNNGYIKQLQTHHWKKQKEITRRMSKDDGYGWYRITAKFARKSMEEMLRLFTDPPGPEYRHLAKSQDYLRQAANPVQALHTGNLVDARLLRATETYLERWADVISIYIRINQNLGTHRGIAEGMWRRYQNGIPMIA